MRVCAVFLRKTTAYVTLPQKRPQTLCDKKLATFFPGCRYIDMAKITKAQERALSLAFRVVDTPEEQQRRIREELAKHGVVRDTAKEWFAILDGLDERTRNLARFEIRVDSAAAQPVLPNSRRSAHKLKLNRLNR